MVTPDIITPKRVVSIKFHDRDFQRVNIRMDILIRIDNLISYG